MKTCLREGKYTKGVKLWVEKKADDISDDEWDHQTIDFALDRVRAKQEAINELRERRSDFPDVHPVVLVAARDIAHADRVGSWLKSHRGFADDEVLIAHSKTARASSNEGEISRLISVDQPGSTVKVVVNVFQLSEGWDVTNVWVVAPLRSLATFSNAIQTIGRGLRLPIGRRVDDDEVDTLDVLCFGKEDFGTIVTQATEEFGAGVEGAATIGIAHRDEHHLRTTEPRLIAVTRAVTVQVPNVTRVPGEPPLDFSAEVTRGISSFVEVYDIGTGEHGSQDGVAVRRDFDLVVRAATSLVLDRLKYLNPVKHGAPVKRLIAGVLTDLGGVSGQQIATDPLKLALGVAESINSRYRAVHSTYVASGETMSLEFGPVTVPVPAEFEELPHKTEVSKLT
ncbi:hypothetical protein NHF48_000740 [Sphingomonas sp. H160509]|uniref:hypothetical protein n=1 Tax=Sphingomonas sp. H160509 TaxID=2955313 RepID=UPI0020982E7C|nr:hypothetical protein [Sphingomonas sp. H160509]MDD1449785.1 hypothetical protein [Sphingomonas sp. H160509]